MNCKGTVFFISSCCFAERDMKYSRWKMAIERSLGWEDDKKITDMNEEGTDIKRFLMP